MECKQSPLEDMVTGMTFWKNKKVFITGHTGFKGGWLSIWLQRLGAHITGYSLPVDTTSLFNVGRVDEGMASIFGDILDPKRLQDAITSCQPEIVIHMAAQALVRSSYLNPVETFSTNVMGTVNLLESARHTDSVKVIVNVTSDKCYENKNWVWGYRESDPMGGHDPYSCSKGCAELVGSAYQRSFFQDRGIAMASVRAGNAIGGGDWAQDRLIPDIFNALAQGKTVAIRNPKAVRPWQHVCEPLHGYLLLAERLWENGQEYAEGWNFGPVDNDFMPVSWIVDYICHKWGDNFPWQHDDTAHPHEAKYLKLDSSKARNKLGWRPKLNLRTALDLTVDWYRAYEAEADMRELTEKQIAIYLDSCRDA